MIQNQKNMIFTKLNFAKTFMTSYALVGYQLVI